MSFGFRRRAAPARPPVDRDETCRVLLGVPLEDALSQGNPDRVRAVGLLRAAQVLDALPAPLRRHLGRMAGDPGGGLGSFSLERQIAIQFAQDHRLADEAEYVLAWLGDDRLARYAARHR